MSAAPPSPEHGRFRQLLSVLTREYGDYRRSIVIATILTGIAAAIEVVILVLIAGIGTSVLGNRHRFDLAFHVTLTTRSAALFTVVAILVRGVDDIIASYYKYNYMERYEAVSRKTLLKHFLDAEWFVQADDDSGNVQTITVVYLRVASTALSQVQDTLTTLTAFVVFLVGAIAKGGLGMLGILIGSALLALMLRPLIEWAHRAGHDLKTAMLAFSRLAIEMFEMAREIRLFNASEHVDAKIGVISGQVAKADRDNYVAVGVLASLQASIIYFIGALGLYAIVALHVDNPAKWVTVVLLVYRGLGNGRVFQANYQSLINSMPSISEMQANREKWAHSAVPTTGVEFEPPLTRIEFDDVGFTYPGGTVALQNASFTVNYGDALGLMGPSGSGKSTIVQLLLRLRLATDGEVRVNGTNIAELRPQSWFGNAVIVPQEAQLFSATVFENVTSFRSDLTREDAIDALRRAYVLDEVMALPDGIDTMLGETGRALSGGQRQRVCIARALAAKPDVLVLDEPTSALDLISEEGIRRTLEDLRGQITIVIIAHRMSTLRVCDKVAVLEHGRIKAYGDRTELEANSAFFAEAVRLSKMVLGDDGDDDASLPDLDVTARPSTPWPDPDPAAPGDGSVEPRDDVEAAPEPVADGDAAS